MNAGQPLESHGKRAAYGAYELPPAHAFSQKRLTVVPQKSFGSFGRGTPAALENTHFSAGVVLALPKLPKLFFHHFFY